MEGKSNKRVRDAAACLSDCREGYESLRSCYSDVCERAASTLKKHLHPALGGTFVALLHGTWLRRLCRNFWIFVEGLSVGVHEDRGRNRKGKAKAFEVVERLQAMFVSAPLKTHGCFCASCGFSSEAYVGATPSELT